MKKDRTDSLRGILKNNKSTLTSITHGKFDFTLFQTFTEIYKHSNITKAAQVLGMPTSNVSNNLSKLREYFQDPLFIRQGSKLTPTKEAHDIYILIENNFEKIHSEFRKVAHRDTLVIHASPYFSVRFLPSLSEFIWKIRSDCEIFHKSSYEENEYNDHFLGDIIPDLTFEFSASTANSMISKEILTEELCFVCAKYHPRIAQFSSIYDFNNEIFVNFYKKHGNFICNRSEYFPTDSRSPSMNSDSLFALLSIISSSEKIGIIPRWLFDKFKDTYPLEIIQTDMALSPLTIYLIYPRLISKSPLLEEIIQKWEVV